MQLRPEEEQFLRPAAEGRLDDVGLDHQVVVDEVGRVGVVGVDATDLGGSEVDLIGPLGFKERAHGGLLGQVQFRMGAGHDALIPLLLQATHDCGTDHPSVTGNVDLRLWIHDWLQPLALQCARFLLSLYVAARLHLDDLQRSRAPVCKAAASGRSDAGRRVVAEQHGLIAAGVPGRARCDDQMPGTAAVRLKAQAGHRVTLRASLLEVIACANTIRLIKEPSLTTAPAPTATEASSCRSRSCAAARSKARECLVVDPARCASDLLEAGDLEALPRSSVGMNCRPGAAIRASPCPATRSAADSISVGPARRYSRVDVGDLQLAARAGLKLRRYRPPGCRRSTARRRRSGSSAFGFSSMGRRPARRRTPRRRTARGRGHGRRTPSRLVARRRAAATAPETLP